MPQKTLVRKTKMNSKASAQKTGPTVLQKIMANKYSRPVMFVVAFMLLGAGALYWASAATTSYSLWSNDRVPKTITAADTSNIELGVKFHATVAGYVTGVKFYKGPQNTGTHTGNLWDGSGRLLASVTFTNETATGWQTASFNKPVSIASNVTYVVSYHAPNGHYSVNANYFKSGPHSRKYLVAPQNTATDPNGVYVASSNAQAFPTQGGNGANYWVDVIFSNKLLSPQPAPAAPANVTASAQGASIAVSWTASASQNAVTNYTVYRNGSKLAAVGTALTYTDSNVQPGATYTYQIQATDSTGAVSALSATASVTMPTAPSTGGTTDGGTTGSSKCPLPAYPNPSCTGVPAGTQFSKTVDGNYTVTTDGAVIDGWHITGNLDINANNVTVLNSQIDGTVDNERNTGEFFSFTITDSTVGPASGCIGMPGVGEALYTATRVYVRGHDDGFRMSGDNVKVQDSYEYACYLPAAQAPPDGSHSDGFQAYCPNALCSGLQLLHNTLDLSGVPATFTLNLVDPNLRNVTVSDNMLLGGGNYIIDSWWRAGSAWTLQNNRLVKDSWDKGHPYPALNWAVSAEGTCAQQNWQGNTVVTIDGQYNIASTTSPIGCID